MSHVKEIEDELKLVQLGLSDTKFRVTLCFLVIGIDCAYTHQVTRDLSPNGERTPKDRIVSTQPVDLMQLRSGEIKDLKQESVELGLKESRRVGSDFVVYVPDWSWYLTLTTQLIEPFEPNPDFNK